jgi:hypothetical protein
MEERVRRRIFSNRQVQGVVNHGNVSVARMAEGSERISSTASYGFEKPAQETNP